jgi:2'-5' RNA ligase
MTGPDETQQLSDRFGPENMGFVLVSDNDDGEEETTEIEDNTGFTPEETARFLAGQMRIVRRFDAPLEANPSLLAAANLDSQTGDTHVGAMIALIPSDADLERLADAGTEGYDQLHLTLFYLGNADDINLMQQTGIVERVKDIVLDWETMAVTGFGAGIWNPNAERGQKSSLVLNVGGCDCLEEAREIIEENVLEAMMLEYPDQHQPWVAHVCLAYGGVPELLGMLPAALDEVGPITFDKVRIAFGPQVVDIPLVYSEPDTILT